MTPLILPDSSLVCGVLVLPSDLVPIHYQSFFKFENLHMWSIQRPSRPSQLITCKTKRGLTCIGFGNNVTADLSFQEQDSAIRLASNEKGQKRPRNLMIETSEAIPAKRINF